MTFEDRIKRVIPLSEVEQSGHYSGLEVLAARHNHDVVEMLDGTWRWRADSLIDWLTDGEHPPLSLNRVRVGFGNGKFALPSLMKFYMGIGYPLSGYCEVFGQKEAREYNLPGARTTPVDEDGYAETLLDYAIRQIKENGPHA